MSKQRNQKTLLFSNMHSTKSNFNSTRTYFQNRISKRGSVLKVRAVATITLCSKIVQIDSANISKLPTTIYRLILLYFLLKDKKNVLHGYQVSQKKVSCSLMREFSRYPFLYKGQLFCIIARM